MKKVIYGYHLTDTTKTIYFWSYDWSKFYTHEVKESEYAIVETSKGFSLVKVEGFGEASDDFKHGHRSVLMFIKKGVLVKEEVKEAPLPLAV